MRTSFRQLVVALGLGLGTASGCINVADFYGACVWPTDKTCENNTVQSWCEKALGEWHEAKSCSDLGVAGCTPPFCTGD